MAQAATLTLTTAEDATPTTLEASCLLAFIDETGDEAFSDPQHPVFGLGGCVVPVGDYTSYVRPTWNDMKSQHFGGADVPLHASDLRAPSQHQLEALCDFFRSDRFTRVVAVASSKTAFPDGHPPFQPIALALVRRIERAALRFPLSSIALIVESSDRANALVNRYLGPFDVARIETARGTVTAPIHRYLLPKSLNEPGLEIADFIMNAVGGQARSRLRDPASPPRRDFAAVIHSVPKHAVEYMAIEKVELRGGLRNVMEAETYDRWYETPRGRWIGQREVALLLGELQPRPGESLLDVGCGTGFFTRALASAIGGPATGVDINPEWVAFARRRDIGKVSYEVADARALPYEAASFDLVVSIAALCFIEEERAAVREMVRVARRRVAIGLLNRRSLLWLRKGRRGGRGGYRGARWHTFSEAANLFAGLPVQRLRAQTAIHLPGGGWLARVMERLWPQWLHTGAFILVVADTVAAIDAPPNNSMQRTALRAGADAERWASRKT